MRGPDFTGAWTVASVPGGVGVVCACISPCPPAEAIVTEIVAEGHTRWMLPGIGTSELEKHFLRGRKKV